MIIMMTCKCTQDGHKSTVVSLSFSSDGKLLASAGKDRRLCIWKKNPRVGNSSFDLSAMVESAHKRIIWSVDFCVTQPSILATGSRDGFVKIWEVNSSNIAKESVQLKEIFCFEAACKREKKAEPITALAFAPVTTKNTNVGDALESDVSNHAVIAIGAENGLIEIWSVPVGSATTDFSTTMNMNRRPCMIHSIPLNDCHVGVVNKLVWKPQLQQKQRQTVKTLTLASCSADHGIRMYSIELSGGV
jgi:WD40 repeat protein